MSNKAPRLCRHGEKPAQSRTGRPVCSECRERLIKEANTRYQKSEAFRATQAHFRVGKKPRAILKRYNRSEKGDQTGKRYRNTERGCANSLSRRHAQHALVVTPVELRLTAEQWRAILERWDYKCAYCGKPFEHRCSGCSDPAFRGRHLTRNHIVALMLGGLDTKSNIVPACLPCDVSKGRRTHPILLGGVHLYRKDDIETFLKEWLRPKKPEER